MFKDTLLSQSQDRVASFLAADGLAGGNLALREVMGSAFADIVHSLEGFQLRNTRIADGTMKGSGINGVGIGNRGIGGLPVSSFNEKDFESSGGQAGRYTVGVKQRSFMLQENKPTRKVFGSDDAITTVIDPLTLEIRTYLKTPYNKMDIVVDGTLTYNQLGSVVISTLENAVIQELNYQLYDLFTNAANEYIDPVLGAAPFQYGNLKALTKEEFSDFIIDVTSRFYNVLDGRDKYVLQFRDNEVLLVFDYTAKAMLLKTKLQIVEGSVLSLSSIFYTGLPYEGTINGFIYKTTPYINNPKNVNQNMKKAFIITVMGQFSPLLHHLQYLNMFVEKAFGLGETLFAYAIVLLGQRIAEIFRQYISVGFWGEVKKNFAETTATGNDVNENKRIDLINLKETGIDYGTANGTKFTVETKYNGVTATNIKWTIIPAEMSINDPSIVWSNTTIAAVGSTTELVVANALEINNTYKLVYGPTMAADGEFIKGNDNKTLYKVERNFITVLGRTF